MFKQLLEALSKIFGALFGTSKPEPTPPPEEDEVDTPQDGADLEQDTVVVVVKEQDVKVVPPDQDDETEEPDSVVANEPDTPSEDAKPVEEPTEEETTDSESTPEEETSDEPKSRYMWCLDNGHGKATPGKRSPVFEVDGVQQQLLEYEFNRAIVSRIIAGLTERGIQFFNVVPEVEGDVPLSERVHRANSLETELPKIYVSVHANAGPVLDNGWSPDSISGVETWYFHSSRQGRKVAAVFQKHIVSATGWKNRHIKSRPSGQFYVLRNTTMPAVLTENGFFTNREQAKELVKKEVRDAIADAHIAAIVEIEKNGIV